MSKKLSALISAVLCGCCALSFAACSKPVETSDEEKVVDKIESGYQLVIQEEDEDGNIRHAYYRYVGMNDEEHRVNTKEIEIPHYFKGEQGAFPVKEISENAFYNYVYLQKVTLPDCIRVIDDRAFYWCEDLVEINMPERLLEIGNEAFSGCIDLEVPDLTAYGDKVSVGLDAFKDCGININKDSE